MSTEKLTDSFAHCRRTTRRFAKSFFFASHALPAEKRKAAYAIYAFCRHADDIIDETKGRDLRTRAATGIATLRTELEAVYSGSVPESTIMPAFQATVERFEIPHEYFLDLLTGVEMDLTVTAYETFDELHRYCYHVASVVGLIMTRILGVSNDDALPAAVDLGVAMQLTNILRDVREDRDRGRCYIPREEMDRFGYTAEDLARGVIDPRFAALMEFQVERAHRYYRLADRGIPFLTADGSRFCVVLMSRTYEAILEVIEDNRYDVFAGRASAPMVRKLGIAVSSLMAPVPGSGRRHGLLSAHTAYLK